MKNVKDFLETHLKEEGYDGLASQHCSCHVGRLCTGMFPINFGIYLCKLAKLVKNCDGCPRHDDCRKNHIPPREDGCLVAVDEFPKEGNEK